jgi:putative glycosyltransferase (TIGR04372 family)
MKPNKTYGVELSNFLGNIREKYAVVKINTNTGNATAVVTNPSTYIDAILYLQQNGYGIVFAGREEMPELFQNLKVLNYANSSIANFRNDIELIAGSKFLLSTGSGFGLLADTMGIPMVATNSWHLTIPFPSRFCVTVPTILYYENGNPMRFIEQINFFYSQEQSSTLKINTIKPRNASSKEILAAVVEAIHLEEGESKISQLQNQFKNLKKESPLFYAESRISKIFIEKFQYLL